MKANAGEATILNFRVLRITPSDPKVVSMASLKPKLVALQLGERITNTAFKSVQQRRDRKFASFLVKPESDDFYGDAGINTSAKNRAPASIIDEKTKKTDAILQKYARHPPTKEDASLNTHFSRQIVAGQDVGEKILFPDKFYGRPQKVKVFVEDPLAKVQKTNQKDIDIEKARLIEELSQIRSE